ncbi:Cell-division control histidine kinase PdhS [Salinivirga cyanobacteriivorans]|uniref:Cell-division control histidine kinase PdhS n=2 Tax=Salinivirga TaxID=1970191 RepID=A0A0S2HWB8_9BACT|nr:GAF domain-containing sensor histidine kinase [Salinivirga cyanobacteriivorans]ALO14310.1 Cell-division control histidine kinase PdhS [Salinivirga cyanobacteriivorans]
MEEKRSTVTIRGKNESKSVEIGSEINFEAFSSIIDKWQSLIDTVAKIVDVPSGLIMRLNEETIEVFLKSQTEGNPYHAGEKADLIYGLYCETVIGTQEELLIPDATKNYVWSKNNPDVDINMIAYLGYPINWPDGKVFGTVCLLDNKENHYGENFKELLYLAKKHIESDLQLIKSKHELEELNLSLQETSSIKTRFLSLISHDVRGGVGTINEFLKLIIKKYDDYEGQKLKEDLIYLNNMANSAFETLENLLSWSKNDLLHLEPEKIDFNIVEMIESLLSFFKLSIKMKNIEVIKRFSEKHINVFADEDMIRTALRNIISNAIKYNKSNGKLKIEVYKKNGHTFLIIEDTGIGMDKFTIEQLFTYSNSHKLKGTLGESSSGIGLFLTRDFLEKNNIIVDVQSNPEKGTKFELTL